jgi:predicted dehydrogenase
MYCCGDPKTRSVSAETFSKLGSPIRDYVYTKMWAGPEKPDGIYDVEEGVTGMVRTEGPVITFNGAWAQNIGENEMYIDFMGDKAGIRLQYGKEFTVYTFEHGALEQYTPALKAKPHFENEIDAYLRCVRTGEKLPSHIDTVVITAQIMQAIYDSSEAHREIQL